MHPLFERIDVELDKISIALKAIGSNEPLNIAHNVWNGPGMTRDELVKTVETLRSWIAKRDSTALVREEKLVADYERRLSFLASQTVPQVWSGNCGPAVFSLLSTLQGLRDAIEQALP